MKTKLTKHIVDKIYPKDKRQLFFDTETKGLVLTVGPKKTNNNCTKRWYYTYRPSGYNPVRIYLAPYPEFSVQAARLRAKKVMADILNKKDPHQIKLSLKKEFSLYELIREFYSKQLKEYKQKTQENMVSCFECWVLHKPKKPGFTQFFTYSIKDKKISVLTHRDIASMHKAISLKSGYSANRVVEYLRILFNWAIAEGYTKNQPVNFTKKKNDKSKAKWFIEQENNKTLTKFQRDNIIRLAYVKDERTGQLNFDYYVRSRLNLVSCLAIVWAIFTGRRQESEGFNITFGQISLPTKTIHFEDTKTGPADYELGPKAIDLIKTINASKLKSIRYPAKSYGKKYKKIIPEKIVPGPWSNNEGDFVFPSQSALHGHITDVRKTWAKLLELADIKYLPLKQCRHTFGTLLLSKSKSLSAVQGALGHANARTTERYAKILKEDVRAALDSFDSEVTTQTAEILKYSK